MHRYARLFLALSILVLVFFFDPQANAANGDVRLYPVPAEVSSTHFVMTIDGKHTPVQACGPAATTC